MTDIHEIDGKQIPAQLKQIAKWSKLMDSQFRIPGTNFRFGIDPIIGLFPVLGDLIDFVISAYLLLAMRKNGASGRVVAKMCLNITIDGIVGAIPILGNIFDVFYKANRRNLILAVEHFDEGKHQGSAWPIVLPILLTLLVVFVLVGIVAYYVLQTILMFLFPSGTL